jgi:hypothetical protein
MKVTIVTNGGKEIKGAKVETKTKCDICGSIFPSKCTAGSISLAYPYHPDSFDTYNGLHQVLRDVCGKCVRAADDWVKDRMRISRDAIICGQTE